MATWYVRPDSSHSGTRNGTTYTTAWGGWSEIVWGGGGVSAGDTLYVCGSHLYSSTITVGSHGGTASSRTIIRGDASEADGKITFVGNVYLQSDKANTIIRNLQVVAGTSNCIFIVDTATNCDYIYNTFISKAANAALSLYAAAGQDHIDVLIDNNTFTCSGDGMSSGKAAALEWFMAASAATSTLTRVTITNNTFKNCNTGRTAASVLQLRVDPVANTNCSITDLIVSKNKFIDCYGLGIRLRDDHAGSTFGTFAGVKCNYNTFINCKETTTAGMGGAISIGSFGISTNSKFGYNEVCYNTGINLEGAAGGVNAFYGSYIIAYNYFENITSTTIDGNGILLDHGCDKTFVYSNVFKNVKGKASVTNSGYVLMLLDSTNCYFYSNIAIDCRNGIHLGDAAGSQSGYFYHNTFVDISDYAIYAHASAGLNSIIVKNNIFTGSTYSVYDNTAISWTGEDYNVFYDIASGTQNHTLGSNDLTSNPQLNSAFLPLNTAIRTAGTSVGFSDFSRKAFSTPPTMGAVQYSLSKTVNNIRGIVG